MFSDGWTREIERATGDEQDEDVTDGAKVSTCETGDSREAHPLSSHGAAHGGVRAGLEQRGHYLVLAQERRVPQQRHPAVVRHWHRLRPPPLAAAAAAAADGTATRVHVVQLVQLQPHDSHQPEQVALRAPAPTATHRQLKCSPHGATGLLRSTGRGVLVRPRS
jgi:hypothetical protein